MQRINAKSEKRIVKMNTKICCIRSLDEAQRAIKAGASSIGFIGMVPPTPRTITDMAIAEIVRALPPNTSTVLVTASVTAEVISNQLRRTGTHKVQLSGQISLPEIRKLSVLEPSIPRTKVVHVNGPEALGALAHYSEWVDAFLLDSGNPTAANPEYGGTGRPHDWSISAQFVQQSTRPVDLAGGLTPDNVAQAIALVNPSGIDVCSGVRTDDQLDDAKIEDFFNAL